VPAIYTDRVLNLVREHYSDFGPTLAREKLLERHGLLSRQYFGELIQIDGSEHLWFEDRGPYCTVLTYVDDATSRLQLLKFVEGESTFGQCSGRNRSYCHKRSAAFGALPVVTLPPPGSPRENNFAVLRF